VQRAAQYEQQRSSAPVPQRRQPPRGRSMPPLQPGDDGRFCNSAILRFCASDGPLCRSIAPLRPSTDRRCSASGILLKQAWEPFKKSRSLLTRLPHQHRRRSRCHSRSPLSVTVEPRIPSLCCSLPLPPRPSISAPIWLPLETDLACDPDRG
jgi:hypothetical protein